MKNKIGVLGSGAVGETLATGLSRKGYPVMIGTRNTSKLAAIETVDLKIGSYNDTAAFGEILILTIKGEAALEVIKGINGDLLKGKTIIDTTNPIKTDAPPKNGALQFFTGVNDSLMEQLQEAAPEANFVKGFNSVGSALMIDPDLGGTKPTMFICGDNDAAKKQVAEICEAVGFEPYDCGKKETAGALEALCILWCQPGFARNDWYHAFKMLP